MGHPLTFCMKFCADQQGADAAATLTRCAAQDAHVSPLGSSSSSCFELLFTSSAQGSRDATCRISQWPARPQLNQTHAKLSQPFPSCSLCRTQLQTLHAASKACSFCMRPPATLAQHPTSEPSQCWRYAGGKAACNTLLGVPQRLTLHEGVQGVVGPLLGQHAHVVEVVLHILGRVVLPPPGRRLCRADGLPGQQGRHTYRAVGGPAHIRSVARILEPPSHHPGRAYILQGQQLGSVHSVRSVSLLCNPAC